MNAEGLRDTIAALLEPELGTYTLPSGNQTPAISLLSTGDRRPTRDVVGLEVVVFQTPILSNPQPMFDGLRHNNTWQIFLVQWQGDDTLLTAREKLEATFPGIRSMPVPIQKGLECREQLSVKIPDYTEGSDWL